MSQILVYFVENLIFFVCFFVFFDNDSLFSQKAPVAFTKQQRSLKKSRDFPFFAKYRLAFPLSP